LWDRSERHGANGLGVKFGIEILIDNASVEASGVDVFAKAVNGLIDCGARCVIGARAKRKAEA